MIFVDTAFFFALTVPWDQWHQFTSVPSSDAEWTTSSLIVDETISLLQTRGYFSRAIEFLDEVRHDTGLRIVYPDPQLQSQAWDEFKVAGSFGANAVDCMSFVIMRRMRIRKAYTFDAHFKAAGFEIIGPER